MQKFYYKPIKARWITSYQNSKSHFFKRLLQILNAFLTGYFSIGENISTSIFHLWALSGSQIRT